MLDHPGCRRLAKPDDIIDRLVGLRCGGENGVLVAFEHLDPMRDVSGVIVEMGLGQSERRPQDRAGYVRDQLLECVSLIAKARAELAVEPLLVARPVRRMPTSA